MKSVAAILLSLAGLAGCSGALTADVHDKMEASLAAYQACLAEHVPDQAACDGARRIYEADRRAYRNIFVAPPDNGGGGGGGGM